MMTLIRCLSTAIIVASSGQVRSFEWSSARPPLNRQSIAGVWKLTPTAVEQLRPMKEFTVYPKKSLHDKNAQDSVHDLLLMLKEDGSFQQCSPESMEEKDVAESWNNFQKKRQQKEEQQLNDFIKGTWDYLDGNLILAADRPDENSYSSKSDGEKKNSIDTVLQGRLVVNYQTRLQDNPVLGDGDTNPSADPSTQSSSLDTHLSVPIGSISIGKFFYPKHHPSFFEQPMFRPQEQGTCALRQVLGSLNTKCDEQAIVEKFQRSDFYNKTFLLTTHPIGYRRKGRWSTKQNKFIPEEDEPPPTPANIRVVEIAFFANNTFSTVAGLGGEAILRGKFDVIGQQKDHLWMQVIRFGFGRSVSGSVYSEGRMLSHEDAKAYWGMIHLENHANEKNFKGPKPASEQVKEDDNQKTRFEVTGSVLDGWGLEPMPVARFIMRQTETNEIGEGEDDHDEDEEEISERVAGMDPDLEDDGIDWSNNDSFQ